MTYRRLSFILAVFVLHGTIGQVKTAQDSLVMMNDSIEIDGKIVTRRGLINQIAEALEGVVAITEDVLNIILLPIKQLIKLDQEAIIQNPHKKEVASVRIGSPICPEELAFRDRRFAIVKAAQERFLGMELEDDDVLEITFSGGGGGVRAKAYLLGACVGASKSGILDTIMCMSALSGSTWFVAPWISSGLPIDQYRGRAIEDICDGVEVRDFDDLGPMVDAFWVKFAYSQHLNIVDVYGGLLGNNLLRGFGKDQHMVYLSDQQEHLAEGLFPLPVYTAVLGEWGMPNYWFEFTPFEIGSRWLGAYVPSWAFGRTFKNGESRSSAPEVSLGFLMGIFGSAFAASFEEAYEQAISKMKLPKFLQGVPGAQKIFEALKNFVGSFALNSDLGELRIAWGQVFNYVHTIKECAYHDYEDLKLVDAGIDFNNPIFATYRKPPSGGAPDIIFVIDSGRSVGFDGLKVAKQYARRMNMVFPEIDRSGETKQALTIFGNEFDPDTPLILYMPRVVDPNLLMQYMHDPELFRYVNRLKNFDIEKAVSFGFAHTFNFEYTKVQAELVADLAEFNVRALAPKIKNILKTRIEVKRARRSESKTKK